MAKAKKKASAKKSAKATRKTIPEKVLESLHKHGPQTSDRLAARIKHDHASVSSACSRLFIKNKIGKQGKHVIGQPAIWKSKSRAAAKSA